MKRGPNIGAIDWPRVCWSFSNRSLQRILDVSPETVVRMRSKHAPQTQRGSGRPPDGQERSGQSAPDSYCFAASTCRQLVHELSAGAPAADCSAWTSRAARRLPVNIAFRRTDTGELFGQRAMTPEERQAKIAGGDWLAETEKAAQRGKDAAGAGSGGDEDDGDEPDNVVPFGGRSTAKKAARKPKGGGGKGKGKKR